MDGEIAGGISSGCAYSRRPRARRLAGLLCLPNPENYAEIDLAITVRAGLPLASSLLLIDHFPGHVFQEILPVAAMDLASGRGEHLTSVESGRLFCVADVVDQLICHFDGAIDEAMAAMMRPHPSLSHCLPVRIAAMNAAGALAVSNLVRTMPRPRFV